VSFLLDTNVVSELRKPAADASVTEWARARPKSETYLSVVTIQEIELGVLLKERRDAVQGALLRSWLDRLLSEYDGRILPVELAVVRRAAALHVPDPRPERDALIAATALVHGLTVVTRNTSDFDGTGVGLVDPWTTA
jgi:predicted nucleic acid-binding protein